MQKLISMLVVALVALICVPNVFAHVVVRPNEVGVGERTNFAVNVPTEESVPTTQVRLVIPEGVKSVRPNVMPGWSIQITKTGEGESERISEIIWSGGSIPADQRAEFVFSAQAPTTEGTIQWKAYQTYANGLVVSWDTDPVIVEEYSKANPAPAGTHDDNAPKPLSITKVVNDLNHQNNTETSLNEDNDDEEFSLSVVLSMVAIILAGTALYLQIKAKKS